MPRSYCMRYRHFLLFTHRIVRTQSEFHASRQAAIGSPYTRGIRYVCGSCTPYTWTNSLSCCWLSFPVSPVQQYLISILFSSEINLSNFLQIAFTFLCSISLSLAIFIVLNMYYSSKIELCSFPCGWMPVIAFSLLHFPNGSCAHVHFQLFLTSYKDYDAVAKDATVVSQSEDQDTTLAF